MTNMDKKSEAGDVERIGYDYALKKYATGRYLVFQFSLLIFTSWAAAINNLSNVFIGADMKHTCQVPSDQTFNLDTTVNVSFTLHYIPDKCTYDKLAVYTNGTNITLEEGVKCNSWVYDKSEFQSTIMSEWDLNECDGKWQISLGNFIYMLGYLTGCIVLGDLSDRYGRSKLLLISNIGMGVSGIAASFSVNLPMLTAMRFLLGVFVAGARNSGFVHTCEIVCSKYMATMTFLHEPLYAIGALFTVGLAQLLNNWRHFQLASACLFLLGVPFYWLIPESPRWQLSMGYKDDPVKYFKVSAKKSKIEIPDKLDVYLEYQPKKEGNVLSLFKTTNIRNKTLVVSSLWFTCGIVGFGMTFNVGNLAGNIFLNSYILNGAGLLTFVGIWYIDLGRRHSIASAFLITAVISVIVVVLEKSGAGSIVIACVAMLASAVVGCIFMFLYVISAEIFPTTMRVTALGMCSGIMRIGGALAPFVALLNDSVPDLPYILFAALSLAAGIIGIKIPETKGRDIPDSLHQAENELPLSSIVWCRNAKDADSDTDDVDSISQTKL